MAMSTVVGISVATTWIVSVQGGMQPSLRVSDLGSSSAPDASGPDGVPDGEPPTDDTGTPPALAGRGGTRESAASRGRGSSGGPVATASTASTPRSDRTASPAEGGRATGTASPQSSGTTAPATPGSSLGGARPSSGTPVADSDQALHGTATVDTADPYASRNSLLLTVDESLTALEVEVRVERSAAATDSGAWSTMPGVTVSVERSAAALVYRFALQSGGTVPPGQYSFTVQYSHPNGAHDTARDSWLASAFGVDHPRAVAVRGDFG
ncbi:hypothetical protein ACIQGZ_20785 [Streptomyces sp. NPDC092296]|uniref:hypothetical protein n=1 Tax=Streptomyces sp. NPDC092296 TaxID=3366012 RepID=UPI00382F6732